MNDYKLSDIASNEMFNFAMYTIESRAIPNMIDGLKPVQRFYLYSSIQNTPKDFKKVSAVSGVVSDYGYNHGESSAAGAGQLMAAEWNNNVCLIEGRGSFGTRQVQQAGAARYVYTRLHSNFGKYIKDLSLAPVHEDPEHAPPAFYVPVLPLVLANGTRGIATGFATNILPRSINDIANSVKEYIETGAIKSRLEVSFPEFKGVTVYDSVTDRHVCRGTFKRPTSTKIIIDEIPYGYDRESYVKILDKLEDDGEIMGYEDQCSVEGFKFEVKLRNQTAKLLKTEADVLRKFKLEKTHSENLTVIGADGKLKEYTDERDLVKDFVEYRNGILQQRIDLQKERLTEESRWLNIKRLFIEAVLNDEIVFKGKSKKDVISQIEALGIEIKGDDGDRLLRMNLLSLTDDLVKELKKQIADNKKELTYWKKTTPKEQFVSDLEEL